MNIVVNIVDIVNIFNIVNVVNIVVNIVLGTLRMGWYSQGHKFGLIDGNR